MKQRFLALLICAALLLGCAPAFYAQAATATYAPGLTVTEVLPNGPDVGGAEAYQFIELTNTSTLPLDLSDYALYRYAEYGDAEQTLLYAAQESRTLAAGQTVVLWLKSAAAALTVSDFNAAFGTALTDADVIPVLDGALPMADSGLRVISNVGDVICDAYWFRGGSEDYEGLSVSFRAADEPQTAYMLYDVNETATPTPGALSEDEAPELLYAPVRPDAPTQTTDRTPDGFDPQQPLTFSLYAETQTDIRTADVLFTDEGSGVETRLHLLREREGENVFSVAVQPLDLINRRAFVYTFELRDALGTVTATEPRRTVSTAYESLTPAFSLRDGDTVGGALDLRAAGKTLLIDGADVTAQAQPAFRTSGTLAFEVNQIAQYSFNAVAQGDDVFGIFDVAVLETFQPRTVQIPIWVFDAPGRTVTLEIHAGDYFAPLRHTIDNNDDFGVKNIRLVLPTGKALTPSAYRGVYGLGAVEHDGLDDQPVRDLAVGAGDVINMGDGKSRIEILYLDFTLSESDYDALLYRWDTTALPDGAYTVSGDGGAIRVTVDNAAPQIELNLKDGVMYHAVTVEATVADASEARVSATLDGAPVDLPYALRAADMTAGEHTLSVTATDAAGNTSEKTVRFFTPLEAARIVDVLPQSGAQSDAPTLSVTPIDETGDAMTVTFKKGAHFDLDAADCGASAQPGTCSADFAADSGDGFPYARFDVPVDASDAEALVSVRWRGAASAEKTFLYVYEPGADVWTRVDAEVSKDGETTEISALVDPKDRVADGVLRVMVQSGEGYTPPQFEDTGAPVQNVDETPRGDYDFTFALESDTQYYANRGYAWYMEDTHRWLLENRERLNLQYVFHTGDLIEVLGNPNEWEWESRMFGLFDDAGLPYGVLAGNHDVGRIMNTYPTTYDVFVNYFGASRFAQKPWYGGSYADNRGHYDLISVGGIDFLMLYMGWDVGDAEIAWLNDVCARYPERHVILCLHGYLSGDATFAYAEFLRIHNEVVATNDNICMVLNGHVSGGSATRVDTFPKADGGTRTVWQLMFNYQFCTAGGAGYTRLLHFDTANRRLIVRTYSPTLDDYDAKPSQTENEGNAYVLPGSDGTIRGAESFVIPFEDLGIEPEVKTLETTSFSADVYGSETIGAVAAQSGAPATFEWRVPDGVYGWYAEATDLNGGVARTPVQTLTVTGSTFVPQMTSQIYEIKDGVIGAIAAGTDAATVIADLDGTPDVRLLRGKRTLDPGETVATGDRLCLYDGAQVVQTLAVAVTADVTGDGASTLSDVIRIARAAMGDGAFSAAQTRAADLDANGLVTLADTVAAARLALETS